MKFTTQIKKTLSLAVIGLTTSIATPALADECMMGEIRMFAGNFAPRNWAFAEGQLLAVSQHNALFSLLGTIYGGDGRTTFGLPDMRGRVPIGVGHGPGLSAYRLGQKTGSEQVNVGIVEVKARDEGAIVALADQPLRSLQPSLGMNYIVCMTGLYPSRN